MKRCPECRRDYTDETLNFCLDDGSPLLEGPATADEPATEVLRSEAPTKTQLHTTHQTAIPADSQQGTVARKPSSKTTAIIIAVAVVLLIGAFFGYRFLKADSDPDQIHSVAVLPLENRSGNADTDYLSDGIADSLIYRLSQLRNLKVSPTSSVMAYKGKAIDVAQIGRELNVDAVMSGRLVQIGESLNISVQLIDVRTNKLLWAEQYDRKTSDLLATQREIAREIVENLKLKVSPQEKGLTKHYTESNEAYQLYLKGRYYWNRRTDESMHRSIEFYQQAIEADPSFALAYSGLADTYNLICAPEAGGGEEAPNDVLPKAKAAALKALEIDDTLAEAHVSLAHPLYYYDRDFAGAEREFKKAIELNPDYATAHHWYALFLTIVGRQTEALAEIKRAQELDPLSLSINVWVGWILSYTGHSDEALEQLLKTKEMDPNFVLTRHRLALLYAERKMYDEAIAEANELYRISGGRLGTLTRAYVYAKAGMRREALEQVDLLISTSKQRFISPGSIAIVYATLGENDTAFKWLEKANAEHDLLALRIKTDPRFESLRGDPRFADLVRRTGLPQ